MVYTIRAEQQLIAQEARKSSHARSPQEDPLRAAGETSGRAQKATESQLEEQVKLKEAQLNLPCTANREAAWAHTD